MSFDGGTDLGLLITLVIALHNIPEGLAIASVLVPRGTNVWTAAAWAVFSSLPQPLLALPAFGAVEAFRPLFAVGLGFAAGAMLSMALKEMVPEAIEDAPRGWGWATIGSGLVLMLLTQAFLGL